MYLFFLIIIYFILTIILFVFFFPNKLNGPNLVHNTSMTVVTASASVTSWFAMAWLSAITEGTNRIVVSW